MFCLRKPVGFLVVVAAAMCCSIPTALAAKPHQPAHKQAAAAVHTAKTAPVPQPLQYAGSLEGVEEFYTQQDADAKVQQALDTGLNTIRVRLLWNWSYLPPSRNTSAVCNLARAGEQKGLKAVILSLEPTQKYWPLIKPDMDWFLANIGNYDQALFDPLSSCIAHPSKLQIIWMIGNEPNIHTFCDGSDKGQNPVVGMLAEHQKCAEREALLLHSSYAFIQSEEKKYTDLLKYNINLPVIGGGLSSNDAPFDFLQRYFQVRRGLGYKSCDMDYFGFHPYAFGGNAFYGLKLEPRLAAALRANKCGVPIIYTEMGYPTAPPPDGSHPCLAYANNTPEAQWVSLVSTAVSMTLSQGVVGYINMKLDDEVCKNGGWSSGLYYSDGTPKPFHDQVRQIFQNVLEPQRQAAWPLKR